MSNNTNCDPQNQRITVTSPDPSTASVEAIATAIQAQRDYINSRFEVLTPRLNAMDEATKVLKESVNRTPTDTQTAIEDLKKLTNEKFSAIKQATQERKAAGLERRANEDKRFDAITALADAKFVTYRTLIDSQAEKVALALDSTKDSITKSEISIDKRFYNTNEWRKSYDDLIKATATRREVEASVGELKAITAEITKQIVELRSRLDVGPAGLSTLQNQYSALKGQTAGSDITMGKIYAGIGAVGAILGIIVLLANGVFK